MKIAFDVKRVMRFLSRQGVDLQPPVRDPYVAHWLLDPACGRYCSRY